MHQIPRINISSLGKKLQFVSVLFLLVTNTFGQRVTISGYVEETGSGEKLIGANIFDPITQLGTTTNNYGFYSLTVPSGEGILVCSYVGYQTDSVEWTATGNIQIDFHLSSAVQLETVEIQAERVRRIEEESQMSRNEIPVEQIRKLPAFLGETDVLKTLQLLPGVQSGTEATSGIYVRGGSIDQNLILVDGVPIYNPTHVLGIFSSFNSDAIKSLSITKGGFPARFGGRLSSIVEVNMRDGHLNEFHGSGQIGLISSKLLLEGPIIRKKSSFLVSIRRSYIDIIGRPIAKMAQKTKKEKVIPTAFFHDINLKANHRFNDRHRLVFSGYFGADNYGAKYNDITTSTNAYVKWGNYLGSLNWNHRMAPKLFANTTLVYTRYQLNNDITYSYSEGESEESLNSLYFSGIEDIGLRYSLDYVPDSHHSLKMGIGWTHHIYSPGALTYRYKLGNESDNRNFNQDHLRSQEGAIYIEDDMEFGPLKMNVGLHYSTFLTAQKFYHSLQPRLSMRYKFPGAWALKASYASMAQYINLLTSEALSLPTDLWVPSTDRIRPQTSWQVAIGGAKTLWQDYELSIEGYYKKMNHVLSYKPGVSFIIDPVTTADWQEKITQGRGWSYGAEFLFQKKFGRTTGWLAYTLSWNNRQFDGINRGEVFPFKYDRRHDISVVLSQDLSDRWSFSGAWIYGTGNAYSIPDSYFPAPFGYFSNNGGYSVYAGKNNYRMSDYHRLDVSFRRTKEKRWGESFWTFGAYNVYSRMNPFFIIQSDDFYHKKLEEISILPIIPYFSWGFKF